MLPVLWMRLWSSWPNPTLQGKAFEIQLGVIRYVAIGSAVNDLALAWVIAVAFSRYGLLNQTWTPRVRIAVDHVNYFSLVVGRPIAIYVKPNFVAWVNAELVSISRQLHGHDLAPQLLENVAESSPTIRKARLGIFKLPPPSSPGTFSNPGNSPFAPRLQVTAQLSS
jgi:hypothetical protein